MTTCLGQPLSRVDGRAKVTGTAAYAAEHHLPNLAYGFVISSPVAAGRIAAIDAARALRMPGVLQVFTHENARRLNGSREDLYDEARPPGSPFIPLQDDTVRFSQQPVALVVAESLELARYAASIVEVTYEEQPALTDFDAALADARAPKRRRARPPLPAPRGDAHGALTRAPARIDAEYRVPAEHHNPLEPFATTAVREDDGMLTLYDKTQGVQNVRNFICELFGFSTDRVRVRAPFVGGAFGAGLRPQYQAVLAVLAADALQRPVRVSLTRQQMFGLCYRPMAWQRVALGASADHLLQAVIHETVSGTSRFEDYSEEILSWSGMLYACANVRLDYKLAHLDLNTPADMRAPGAAWGVYALESAIDELAVELGADPIELRLKNYSSSNGNNGLPYSSKALRECYRQGAERFGWSRRSPQPRSMRDGHTLVGWGMATGVWGAWQQPASATCVLNRDGSATVSSATEDIGTGTYTVMTQVAAEALGLPVEQVTFELGDSTFAKAPLEGGSFTVSSVGSAVKAACDKARARLFHLAAELPGSPLADVARDDLELAGGFVRSRRDTSRMVSSADAMRYGNVAVIEEDATTGPGLERQHYDCESHSAVFAEVRVDEDFKTIQVSRIVSAVASGRVLNTKTGRSQIVGGIVWGIGMALEEASLCDCRFGRFMNHNLAEYHVPVNADIHDIDVIFVDEHDEVVNPLGAKGLGEMGVVGVAAAIANAVFHATGRRIRELPITLDKL